MILRSKLTWLALLFVLLMSCQKHNEEELYGAYCETENISFERNIKPLIENRCLVCHSNNNASSQANGVVLEGYNNLKLKVDDGSLVNVISHKEGYEPMPRNNPKLNDCSINMVKIWVSEGAQNN